MEKQVNRTALKNLAQLEKYQQNAYACGSGEDWLIHIGENVSRYLDHCVDTNTNTTMAGFLSWIDKEAKQFGVAHPPEDGERV